MSEFSWQKMKIDGWKTICDTDIANTPAAIMDSLCSIGLPVRVYVKNILKPDWCGILKKIWQNGQLWLQIKKLNVADERRGRDEEIEKTEEILFNKDISLELPIFER